MKASAETRLLRADGKLKMVVFARTFRRLFQVVAVLFLVCKLCDSVGKYENGCVVCRKISQPRPFQKTTSLRERVGVLFWYFARWDDRKNICVGCRRAVQGYRHTGKRIHHVCNLETLLNIQCASSPVNLNSFCKNRLQ